MTAFVGRKAIFEDFGAQSDVLTSMRECDGVWLTRSSDDGQTWEPAYKASVSPIGWGQPSDEPLAGTAGMGTLLMAVQGMMCCCGLPLVRGAVPLLSAALGQPRRRLGALVDDRLRSSRHHFVQ